MNKPTLVAPAQDFALTPPVETPMHTAPGETLDICLENLEAAATLLQVYARQVTEAATVVRERVAEVRQRADKDQQRLAKLVDVLKQIDE